MNANERIWMCIMSLHARDLQPMSVWVVDGLSGVDQATWTTMG